MLKIGLCGGSGSGKGLVGLLLCELGFPCLDTDKLVHDMYKNDLQLIDLLRERFGDCVISRDGSVDRSVLRKIVFSSKSDLNDLNQIVHKRVRQRCFLWLEEQNQLGYKAAFIDAPQLFEAGMEKDLDYIISVICDPQVRIKRIMERDKISEELAKKRIENQISNLEYSQKSHFIIINESDLTSVRIQLSNILSEVGLIDQQQKGGR